MSTCNGHAEADLAKLLQAYFPPEDIEWKPDRFFERQGQVQAVMLAYVTNRAIMARLDEVCGPGNWSNHFERWGTKGVLCTIGLRFQDQDRGQYWAEKTDGADETQIEPTKGGLSSSMKRTGSQWGIGRYLYSFPDAFCPAQWIDRGGKRVGRLMKWKDTPAFPEKFLPGREGGQSARAPEPAQEPTMYQGSPPPQQQGTLSYAPTGEASLPPGAEAPAWYQERTKVSPVAHDSARLDDRDVTTGVPRWFFEDIRFGMPKEEGYRWGDMTKGSEGGARYKWLEFFATRSDPYKRRDGSAVPQQWVRGNEITVARAQACLIWLERVPGVGDNAAQPARDQGDAYSDQSYGPDDGSDTPF